MVCRHPERSEGSQMFRLRLNMTRPKLATQPIVTYCHYNKFYLFLIKTIFPFCILTKQECFSINTDELTRNLNKHLS
jgi:hypothetical protein